MKKNYTSPVVEINAFDVEDVVMTSGTRNMSAGGNGLTVVDEFKTEASTAAGNDGAVFVQW